MLRQVARASENWPAGKLAHAIKASASFAFTESYWRFALGSAAENLVNDFALFQVSMAGKYRLVDALADGSLDFDFFVDVLVQEGLSEPVAQLSVLREVSRFKERDESEVESDLSSSGTVVAVCDEFMDVFFDVLNHLAGYHPLNNFEEQQDRLDSMVDVVLVIGASG